MDRLRVAVLAADPLVRRGLTHLLAAQPGLEVLAEATGDDPFEADVLLWDAEAALERLELREPVLALVPDDADASELLAAGVLSVLYRDASDEQLVAALYATAHGLTVLDPAIAAPLAEAAPTPGGLVEELTPREAEVLALLAEGLSNKALAKRLKLSEHTVKFHLSALLGKFGVGTRTELVVRALQLGRVRL